MSTKVASPLWDHYESLEQQQNTFLLGMWLFLATEILVFGAIFTGYTVYRMIYPASFEAASGELNALIGVINTVVLLTSSLTMALAVRTAKLGHKNASAALLALTALFGAAFLGIKAVEYYGDYRSQLVPGLAFDAAHWEHGDVHPGQVRLFLFFYYALTGLHAVHLTIGIAVIAVLAGMAGAGRFAAAYYAPIEAWGLYWHFVDVVWIFLLPLLYLIGQRTHWY